VETSYLVAGLAIAAATIAFAVLLVRRRRQVWRLFAREHGLRFVQDPVPRVTGTVDGRPVELTLRDRKSDTAELGAQPIRLSVRLDERAPRDLLLQETGAAVRAVHGLIEDDVISTDDAAFDARFTVHARSKRAALAYLDDDRRAALCELARENDTGFITLRGPRLSIDARSLISDPRALERGLGLLLACARRLDASRTAVPRRAAGGARR
jgi:hypothetical protein